MTLSANREKVYEQVCAEIVRTPTPLIKYRGETPNDNTIWIKAEYTNFYGSHYDRVYWKLFRHFEEQGKDPIDWKAVETTSGSGGISFAGIGGKLGFECHVLLPGGGEKRREAAIRQLLRSGDHLHLTPAERYVNGLPRAISRFLVEARRRGENYLFMNHMMGEEEGTNNEITLRALEDIGNELLSKIQVDYFIPAVGNGSSILGPGRVLAKNKTHIVAFETVQSAVAYSLLYPERYEAEFNMGPGILSRHRMPGTSFYGVPCPHILNAINTHLVQEVILVSDHKTDLEYSIRTNGKSDTTRLVHWDTPLIQGYEEVGRSTMAGINVALEIAKRPEVSGKNLVVIGYDKIDRYDSRY
jgi:cysteine synthase A